LAILLVVFGHIVARQDPSGVHWYEPVRRAIYAFHMPFFMYLSGYVSALSVRPIRAWSDWRMLVHNRARRLLRPFCLIGLLIVIGKMAASSVMHVDHRPDSLGSGLIHLVWHTDQSPALSIWYLAVLFMLAVIVPVLLALDHGRVRLALLVALLLYPCALPRLFYIDRVAVYGLFFVLGLIAGRAGVSWIGLIRRWGSIAFAVLLMGCAAVASSPALPPRLCLLIMGCLSMPALHSLVISGPLSSSLVLERLGRYSLMIYLFNTIFIGLAKGLLLLVWSWNGIDFVGFAICLMVCGVVGPVALKNYAFKYWPSLDRLTD
jgi:fucose 4-O-acetylase-like acetyltransferase